MAGMLSSCRPSQSSPAFTEQQLKQLRAQCLVFLAFRNNMEPTKKHLEIALGQFSAEGSRNRNGDGGADNRDVTETGSSSSSPVVLFSVPTAVLPPPDPLDLSTLRLSSPPPQSGAPTRRIVRRGPHKIQ